MIVSIHIADIGPGKALSFLRARPAPGSLPGLSYAECVTTAPLSKRLLPIPRLGRVGLIAAWDDDAALDRFCAEAPLARQLEAGWMVRTRPLRVFGSWPQMPGLPSREIAAEDEEPIAVLTLGRPRPQRLLPFLRNARDAEVAALESPALLAGTGLALPPRLVATFSLWRSNAAMVEYAHTAAGAHHAAVRNDRAQPFHHASAFIRLRPYASQGSWDGHDPLAGLLGAPAPNPSTVP